MSETDREDSTRVYVVSSSSDVYHRVDDSGDEPSLICDRNTEDGRVVDLRVLNGHKRPCERCERKHLNQQSDSDDPLGERARELGLMPATVLVTKRGGVYHVPDPDDPDNTLCPTSAEYRRVASDDVWGDACGRCFRRGVELVEAVHGSD